MTQSWRNRAAPWILGAIAIFLLAVGVTAATLIETERNDAIAATERQLERFVSGAEAAINRNLLGLDVMLADVGVLHQSARDIEPINRLLRSAANQNMLVRQILLLDAAGQVVASSARSGQPSNHNLPAGFLDSVATQSLRSLAISAPATSFASGERVLYFARQFSSNAQQPMFAVTEVQISNLAKIMAQGVEIEGLEVTLERNDGQLLASVPPNEALLGQPLATPLALTTEHGVRQAPARLGGQAALLMAHPTLYRNLLIAAGIPVDAALSEWRQERNRVISAALAFVLLILLAGIATLWYLARLRRYEAELEQRVAQRTKALETANQRLRESEELLRNIAHHDPLTGLANRLLLEAHLQQSFKRARRDVKPFALMMIDLDGFKAVNDTHGHEAGDLLLKQVSQRLLASVRESDLVTRLGGDEFVCVLESVTNRQTALTIGDKLIHEIGQPIHLADSSPVKVGASIGISLFDPASGDPRTLMQTADESMYAAKTAGKNRCVITSG